MKKIGQNSSLFDQLLHLMPGLEDQIKRNKENNIDTEAANTLFTLWKKGSGKLDAKVIKRPGTVSINDVEKMKKAGLVNSIGENIEITEKGAKVIKIMILGNDHNNFRGETQPINYQEAVKNIKSATAKRKGKKYADSFWDQFE